MYTLRLTYTATVDVTSTFSKEDAWADIEAANAPVFKMLFDDEAGATTGIETIEQNTESKSNVIYDLQGRHVYEPLKSGVYIINGKKVVK